MPRSPAARMTQLVAGMVLMIVAPVTAPLPGPAATFLFAGGLVLVLRNSHRARLRFARAKRRHPRIGALLDRAMRRSSALRRRRRDAARVDL
ncbi:MAG TPA: hypothetical protein VF643_09660 [Sphingomonas sp.]